MPRRRPASRSDLQRAVNMAAIEPHQGRAAERLGLKRQTYHGWLRQAREQKIGADGLEEANEWERLQDQLRELKAELSTVKRDNLTAAIVRKHILGLAEMSPQPPNWLSVKAKKDEGADVPCLLLSDWHWGEVVDPQQVNGVNEYNIAVAQKRARRVVERAIELCTRHQQGNKSLAGIVVFLGGDMISGNIHDELRETNEIPVMPVMLDLFGVLIWALKRLAEHFGRVFVAGVSGNHGRNTVAPRFKDRNYTNFDWLLYCFLETHFADDKRLQFYIPPGADALVTVAGRRFLLTHGDNLGVRGGDGIIGSIGPIIRGDVKIRTSQHEIAQPYDTLVMGHWHQYMPLDRVIVNGSLKGWDEYSKLALRAVPEPPRQALFFVHPQWGITSNRAVYADESRRAASVEFVSWPRGAT